MRVSLQIFHTQPRSTDGVSVKSAQVMPVGQAMVEQSM
jgi:hypothetical protein